MFEFFAVVGGIIVDGFSGSGFLVRKNLGATNAHIFCVKFQTAKYSWKWVTARATAKFPGGAPFPIRISAVDVVCDLLLFKIPKKYVRKSNFVRSLCLDNLLLGQALYFVEALALILVSGL